MTNWSDVTFTPLVPAPDARHHEAAAAGNTAVTAAAQRELLAALTTPPDSDGRVTHLLLKAAAGAGKSHALKRLIAAAAGAPGTRRVGVTAFTNNQIRPLAQDLAGQLGRDRVCLHLSKKAADVLPPGVTTDMTVSTTAAAIPPTADVVVATAHKLKAPGERGRLAGQLGVPDGDALFDALFVDEAWQLPHHLFDAISGVAPLIVGVGDVGQLPPLEIGANPWRGDARHNPYRAWPNAFTGRPGTWERELPAVWRPAGEALGLWRAFYPTWAELNSVAAPGERTVTLHGNVESAPLWRHVGSGAPTLVEVTGLPDSEAPDIDLPLTDLLERWLDDLFTAGFTVEARRYADDGTPLGETVTDRPGVRDDGDPLVVILATRNQAVDDATALVERLRLKHGLRERDLVASTVDSWQGQTNAITVALHPLSGATALDEFNSAFGRLAVACTRATHGLLVLARAGLDDLLAAAPARPGTPFGEPGVRQLPRQTHQRIVSAFTRATVDVTS
ncbi:hypothetical protein [Micropruina glycogenica]|uniref:AAA domain-containing protein n=1 Tax=Micropruina glycogenica TaxID=75385 RepID=A0A2N9JD18_9ACTN|nr:hypothetical protein [Micropruina glycogenica]SPD85274.1 conserved protein of unknown function [Micropruina glycogenica]